MSATSDVIIVGGGLAGLSCAIALKEKGIPCLVLEAAERVGGRVRTDVVEGFLLDRGFQILLTAYPEAKRLLDYEALSLKPFFPGALIRTSGRFHKVADPFRRPADAIESILSPVGSLKDKVKVALLAKDLRQKSLEQACQSLPAQMTAREALSEYGFSLSIIMEFFKPFFSGIFLEPDLETTSGMFNFIFKMLAEGANVLPAKGMQAIPDQLAGRLSQGSVKTDCPVEKIDSTTVTLSSGERLRGSAVVIATDENTRRKLLSESASRRYRSQTCLYFTAEKPPVDEPILILNGEGRGLVNNFCVPTNVAPSYALAGSASGSASGSGAKSRAGEALLSATVVGNPEIQDSQLVETVREQMSEWFGASARKWRHLSTYRVKQALPDQTPSAVARIARDYKVRDGVYTCGDYMETGSINGALLSGRRVAESIASDLAG